MKFVTVIALAFSLSAFADHHKEAKKVGHDKEHQHVEKKADHEHEEGHHKPHDHKAHHPEHVEAVKKAPKK